MPCDEICSHADCSMICFYYSFVVNVLNDVIAFTV